MASMVILSATAAQLIATRHSSLDDSLGICCASLCPNEVADTHTLKLVDLRREHAQQTRAISKLSLGMTAKLADDPPVRFRPLETSEQARALSLFLLFAACAAAGSRLRTRFPAALTTSDSAAALRLSPHQQVIPYEHSLSLMRAAHRMK
jgi:hypothetical protein